MCPRGVGVVMGGAARCVRTTSCLMGILCVGSAYRLVQTGVTLSTHARPVLHVSELDPLPEEDLQQA